MKHRSLEPKPYHGSGRIRVVLVDDHAMMRQGLRSVLDGYSDLEVVAEAADGHEAVSVVERYHPTVVVMDINMPAMNGIEATAQLKQHCPEVKVLVLSVHDDTSYLRQLLATGAEAATA